MSTYKTFAIWGAGNLGGRIASALLDRKVPVIILTRPASVSNAQNKQLARKGAQIRPFDVSASSAPVALEDIDVLISTTGVTGLALQHDLIRAAAVAHVKLFVPAEFGDPTDGRPELLYQAKIAVRTAARAAGLRTAAFYPGLWTEFVSAVGFDFDAREIVIQGEGDGVLSTTSIEDVARFTAYVLTVLPREQLEDQSFPIEGDRITFNGLAAALNKAAPSPLRVTHVPRAELEARAAQNPFDRAVRWLVWDRGEGVHTAPLAHALFPGFAPKNAIEVLKPRLR